MSEYFKKQVTKLSLSSNSDSQNSPLEQGSVKGSTKSVQLQGPQHGNHYCSQRIMFGRLGKNVDDANNVKQCEYLIIHQQSREVVSNKQIEQVKSEYYTRLNASIDVIRWLLREGLSFRSHDESEISKKKDYFLSLLQFHAETNDDVGKVVLKNASDNDQLTTPSIRIEIASACYEETINAIVEEIGGEYFSILVDESHDTSCKHQLTIVLRFVDKKGFVNERLVGLKHVSNTTSASLKEIIYSILSQLSLSPSQIRGQGYDGASNIQGHVNGLRSLIMQDSPSAHYVHCFAHQLQLILMGVAHNHNGVGFLLNTLSIVLNLIDYSYKLRDEVREKQAERVEEALRMGEIFTGRGLNQELGLLRLEDSHWGTFKNFIILFGSIVDVLDALNHYGNTSEERNKAAHALDAIQTFEFVFLIHLMSLVFGTTKILGLALQRRDQDIANVISLLDSSKKQLQMTRDAGWNSLFANVHSFCVKHDIEIPSMYDLYTFQGQRAKRRVSTITNEHYYRVDVFNSIIDMQMQELNGRFPKTTIDLLLGLHCLLPEQFFTNFDEKKILRMARLYPIDFNELEIEDLHCELATFIMNVRDDERFTNLSELGEFSRKLVQTKKHLSFPLVYKLFKLALILPVSTPTVERVFYAMKHIETDLRPRLGDEFLNDTVVTYFEYDLFANVSNDDIMNRFHNMKSRRG